MKVIRRPWNEAAAGSLVEAAAGDLQFIKDEVLNGVSVLWECVGCGWLVTRIECKELVFVVGSGSNAKEVIKLFMKNKKQLNITTMRVHSARGGMGRYLSGLGFSEVERVYSVAL